ncbi:hypothetical protein NLU13_6289 [Sarocladium strictum]|uniref:Uncharacterized protein n=1 Tax=Sarocladium strictum TaxID=5046 RepID=A0AA39GFM0_SARSR|nr:hypothetical protein NLU13_6289 [Sarocladium strictum]
MSGIVAGTGIEPVYYELSWSILSTICLANILFGGLVIGITSFSPVATVPIVTSAAGAVANGLCYYAFYNDSYGAHNRAVASVFADVGWLVRRLLPPCPKRDSVFFSFPCRSSDQTPVSSQVQEAGFSFYSYIILNRVLRDTKKKIFILVFWLLILGITAARVIIAIQRAKLIIRGDDDLQPLINHLHIVYFVLIALVECFSAYFLLRTFATAKRMSHKAALGTGLFRHLMRSTEVRLALLAVLGTLRAITYSFQMNAQSASDVASQIDRFAYTMECLFPIIMFIDILASKLAFNNQGYEYSSRSRRNPQGGTLHRYEDGGYASNKNGHIVTVQGGASKTMRRTSSEEQIVDRSSAITPSDIGLEAMDPRRIGVSRTVEVEVHNVSQK